VANRKEADTNEPVHCNVSPVMAHRILQVCVNSNGSFSCQRSCDSGYNKTVDNNGVFSCEDINECTEETHNCGTLLNGDSVSK